MFTHFKLRAHPLDLSVAIGCSAWLDGWVATSKKLQILLRLVNKDQRMRVRSDGQSDGVIGPFPFWFSDEQSRP